MKYCMFCGKRKEDVKYVPVRLIDKGRYTGLCCCTECAPLVILSLLDMLEDYGAAKRWINDIRLWLKAVLEGNKKILRASVPPLPKNAQTAKIRVAAEQIQ